MRTVKKEIRILAFDDAPFIPRTKSKAIVIGVVFKGGKDFDGMLKTEVDVDGINATDIITHSINNSKYKGELRVVIFKGITIAGFNLIDIKRLYKITGLPVIVVSRKNPDFKKIQNALKNFEDFKDRWQIIKNAGRIYKLKMKNNKNIYYQFIGLKQKEAIQIILLSCTRSSIPEPLRVAHMIASAIIKGESGGRA